jgi:hypothetical protein
MEKNLRISSNIRKPFLILYMTLHPISSEFPYMYMRKILFSVIFGHCNVRSNELRMVLSGNIPQLLASQLKELSNDKGGGPGMKLMERSCLRVHFRRFSTFLKKNLALYKAKSGSEPLRNSSRGVRCSK